MPWNFSTTPPAKRHIWQTFEFVSLGFVFLKWWLSRPLMRNTGQMEDFDAELAKSSELGWEVQPTDAKRNNCRLLSYE